MSSLLQPVQLKVFNTAFAVTRDKPSPNFPMTMRFCHTAIESATKDKEIVVMSQIQKYLEKGPNLVEVTKTSEGWEGLPKRAVIEGHAGFGTFWCVLSLRSVGKRKLIHFQSSFIGFHVGFCGCFQIFSKKNLRTADGAQNKHRFGKGISSSSLLKCVRIFSPLFNLCCIFVLTQRLNHDNRQFAIFKLR